MNASTLIANILRHDRKTASYKIALIRSLNDMALGYAHLAEAGASLAVPLRSLAVFWVAYYWPFVSPTHPIQQGVHPQDKQDISFRPALTQLRRVWEHIIGGDALASDGFFLVGQLQGGRRGRSHPPELLTAYGKAIGDIVDAIQQPIRYAGPGEYGVFTRPQTWRYLQAAREHIVCIPGTQPNDRCIEIDAELWAGFGELSLWIEALCIHEWSIFTEGISGKDRGLVYTLLTNRPDNRRPLTWERNQIEILMIEGRVFRCPWTGCKLTTLSYDLDHLVPLSIYPINEMWNLIPSEAGFNRNKKRDRLPGQSARESARPRLAAAYQNYISSPTLAAVINQDARMRFDGRVDASDLPTSLAVCAVDFLETIATNRNLSTF